jgi:methyl-accepting chemotaxis protein
VVLSEADQRAERMLHDEQVRADGMLSKLLLAHWPLAVGFAAIHGYWVVAVVASSVLSLGVLWVVRSRPGTLASRLTVAAAFMGYSALLIQETHGATVMHFDVFAGLAFLTLYRDWRVPVFGGLVIALHHLGFHLLQVAGTGFWVFSSPLPGLQGFEMVGVHAAFVAFEVAVLVYISVSLAAETREQAALLLTQENDQASMLVLAEGLRSRDLSVGSTVKATGEDSPAIGTLRQGIGHVAELVEAIERTAAKVASASLEMVETTTEAGRASSEVASSLTQMADGAQRQVYAVGSARQSAAQVREAVASSAESARLSAETVLRVQEAAGQGVAAAAEATVAAQAVNETSAHASQAIGELAAKSEQIGTIVRTITGIAEQTNLLALNAAIEAARAGESGKGFAVVAEEVRKLADESQQAAASISQIVREIQSETRLAVSAVEDGAHRSGESAAIAVQTGTAFERISEAVMEMSRQSADISRATGQIADGAERMHDEIESIASVAEQASSATEQASAATEQNSASTQEVAASAEVLAGSAEELRQLVDAFHLGDTPASHT